MGKIYYKDVSYGGGGSSTLNGSIVGVEQVQKSGNLIAVISVDEDDTNIYSPLPPLIDVKVNDASVLDPVTQTAQVYTHKSLTKAEYEAIPSSVSHSSNIIYAITDEPKLYLNGIEYNGTGGGQTSVVVSPITTTGTQIASISVDGIISNIYAPSGGDEYVAGDNIIMSTASGQPTTVSAIDTTYSSFTSTEAGLVPPPTTAVNMFLKSDGTWAEAGGGGVGNVIDVYENGVSVLDENNIAQTHSYKEITQAEYDALYPPGSTVTDNILYAIKDGAGGSGGGGASALADLDDVDISTPTNGQVLSYDETAQKWINTNGGGSSSGSGYTKTLLWDYITDNNGNVPYNPFNFTLHDNINNYDLLLVENASSTDDLSGSNWKATTQFFVDVNALNNAYEHNYLNYTSFANRSSRYYIKDTTFQKTINNQGNTNGLVRVWGLKFGGGTTVVANPSENPTDKLLKIQVGNTIYNSALSYSTTEQVVGTWHDGREIYQKSYVMSNFRVNANVTFNHNISNLDQIISFEGCVKSTGDSGYITAFMPMEVTSTSTTLKIAKVMEEWYAQTYREWTFTIKYLKTSS